MVNRLTLSRTLQIHWVPARFPTDDQPNLVLSDCVGICVEVQTREQRDTLVRVRYLVLTEMEEAA